MGYKDFTINQIKKIVADSYSFSEVIRKLGYKNVNGRNHWTIQKLIKEYDIDTSHFRHSKGIYRTDEELFVEHSDARPKVVRYRFKKNSYKPYKCEICGIYEWGGQPLTLIFDHINGNTSDNRLSNLRWVCPNCNSQLKTTGFHGKRKYDVCGNKLEIDENIKVNKKNYCVDCGKEISPRAKRCNNCQSKLTIKPIQELPISRDNLKNKIRNTSFLQIGYEYNVTDNTIRKWCKKLNLPYKSSEIKKFTDDEWKLI